MHVTIPLHGATLFRMTNGTRFRYLNKERYVNFLVEGISTCVSSEVFLEIPSRIPLNISFEILLQNLKEFSYSTIWNCVTELLLGFSKDRWISLGFLVPCRLSILWNPVKFSKKQFLTPRISPEIPSIPDAIAPGVPPGIGILGIN